MVATKTITSEQAVIIWNKLQYGADAMIAVTQEWNGTFPYFTAYNEPYNPEKVRMVANFLKVWARQFDMLATELEQGEIAKREDKEAQDFVDTVDQEYTRATGRNTGKTE